MARILLTGLMALFLFAGSCPAPTPGPGPAPGPAPGPGPQPGPKCTPLQNAFFVKADAKAGGDGKDFATAFNTIQAAADAVQAARKAGNNQLFTIAVAKGTYNINTPSQPSDDAGKPAGVYFTNATNIKLWGGFTGDKNCVENRTEEASATTLDFFDGSNPGHFVGVRAEFDPPDPATANFTIEGFRLTRAHPGGTPLTEEGGGISIINGGSGTRLANLIFDNNATDSDGGGALSVRRTNITIEKCVFTNNQALSSAGGAILLGNSTQVGPSSDAMDMTVTISNSTFGIQSETDTIGGNKAGLGGAIAISKDTTTAQKSKQFKVAINDSNFWGNEAVTLGGGAIHNGGLLTVNGGTFDRNRAKGKGQAIYVENVVSLATYTAVGTVNMQAGGVQNNL